MKNKLTTFLFLLILLLDSVSATSISFVERIYPVSAGGKDYSVTFTTLNTVSKTCSFWVNVGDCESHTTSLREKAEALLPGQTATLSSLGVLLYLSSCNTVAKTAEFTLSSMNSGNGGGTGGISSFCGDHICNTNTECGIGCSDCTELQCCGDGYCDKSANGGETCATCVVDCPCGSAQICSNHNCATADGNFCTGGYQCASGICIHNVCRSEPWFCGDGYCDSDHGEKITNCKIDCGSGIICGNGVCESGENCGNCWSDCSCSLGYTCKHSTCVNKNAQCGNNICEESEYYTNCCEDCQCPSGYKCSSFGDCEKIIVCGDNVCSIGESYTSCPKDCSKPSCSDECYFTGDACINNAIYWCYDSDGDGCKEKTIVENCGSGKTCKSEIGKTASCISTVCKDDCSWSGKKCYYNSQLNDVDVWECKDIDYDNCKELVIFENCQPYEECENADCVKKEELPEEAEISKEIEEQTEKENITEEIPLNGMNEEDLKIMANDLVPVAVENVGAMFLLFWDSVPPDIKTVRSECMVPRECCINDDNFKDRPCEDSNKICKNYKCVNKPTLFENIIEKFIDTLSFWR